MTANPTAAGVARRPVLTLLMGAPGSGKSTLAATRFPAGTVYARDWARQVVSGQVNGRERAVFRRADGLLWYIVSVRLDAGLDTVVDSSGLSPTLTSTMLRIARRCGAVAELLIVDTSLPLCLARNAARPGPAPGESHGRRVDPAALRAMHAQVQAILEELAAGAVLPDWDRVTVCPGDGAAGTTDTPGV